VKSLKEEVENFMKFKVKHRHIISEGNKDPIHPVHYYDDEHNVKSKVKNLKWNYNEYRVNFSVDKNMFKVWKYYLSRLLIDEEKPKIDLKI